MQRIENMSLWQSFAAKRQSLQMRAKAEGKRSANYEHVLLFHGTSSDVITKIMEQVRMHDDACALPEFERSHARRRDSTVRSAARTRAGTAAASTSP